MSCDDFLFLSCDPNPRQGPAAKDMIPFFANVISGWTVEATTTDQSALSTVKGLDLQVGQLSGTAIPMAHRMGLVKMSMGTAAANTIPETILYVGNSTTKSYQTSNYTSALTSQPEFDNFTPFASGGYYYLMVKPQTAYSLNSAFKATSDVSGQSPQYQWSQVITSSDIAKGYCLVCAPKPIFKTFGRVYSYTGISQFFSVPYSGNYELRTWGYGTTSVGLGGYAAGTVQLADVNEVLVVDVGGQRADGTYYNTNGTTAIRLDAAGSSSVLNYTPSRNNNVGCFYGPYWKMPAGRYTVTFIGTDLDKSTSYQAYTIYRHSSDYPNKAHHSFTVENYVQTSTYITGTLVADIDTSDDSTAGEGYTWGGLEFVIYFPKTEISNIPTPQATIVADDLASLISGGGCGSSNNVSGVSNSTSTVRTWDGAGKAEIILKSRN